jgi:hypothetical protein
MTINMDFLTCNFGAKLLRSIAACVTMSSSVVTTPVYAQAPLIPPVNAVQTIRTPMVTVTAGAQVGTQNTNNTTQNSKLNVYAVTQVGPHSTAVVAQTGNMNTANIHQVAPSNPIGW